MRIYVVRFIPLGLHEYEIEFTVVRALQSRISCALATGLVIELHSIFFSKVIFCVMYLGFPSEKSRD